MIPIFSLKEGLPREIRLSSLFWLTDAYTAFSQLYAAGFCLFVCLFVCLFCCCCCLNQFNLTENGVLMNWTGGFMWGVYAILGYLNTDFCIYKEIKSIFSTSSLPRLNSGKRWSDRIRRKYPPPPTPRYMWCAGTRGVPRPSKQSDHTKISWPS